MNPQKETFFVRELHIFTIDFKIKLQIIGIFFLYSQKNLYHCEKISFLCWTKLSITMSSSMDRFHLHALSVQFDSFLNKVQAIQTIACMAAQDEKNVHIVQMKTT